MGNINSLNREVQDRLNGQNHPVNRNALQGSIRGGNPVNRNALQGSVRGGNPVNSNASPPIPPYRRDNQTNNNLSGRRNAIVPGNIPENFQIMQQNRRQQADTQVQIYEGETDQLDETTRPSYNQQQK